MFNKSFGSAFGAGTGAFGTFGQQRLFGTTNTTSNLFGGSSEFTATQPGIIIKFNPPTGSYTEKKSGVMIINTKHQCITAMKEYENKSLEELRLEDYQAGRKGPSNAGGVFGVAVQATPSTATGIFGSSAFGISTSSGALFGMTNTTSNPFGGTSSLLGSSGFTATQLGTTINFYPPIGSDTEIKRGVTTSINTKHQCIAAMKEYENKSLEELRLEDYQAGRKGHFNTDNLFWTAATATSSTATGLFGSSGTGFSFKQTKPSFSSAFRVGGLFEMTNTMSNPFGGISFLFGSSGFRSSGTGFKQASTRPSASFNQAFISALGTKSGGLFGMTNTTSNPFGGTSSLLGSSGFTATQLGTTIKFNPPTGSDTMVKSGVTTSINTKHQCITAMKEYENKSVEELRLEDYEHYQRSYALGVFADSL